MPYNAADSTDSVNISSRFTIVYRNISAIGMVITRNAADFAYPFYITFRTAFFYSNFSAEGIVMTNNASDVFAACSYTTDSPS